MTATCSTCKHWDEVGMWGLEHLRHGRCTAIGQSTDDGACLGHCCLNAVLYTFPDFGCTLHTPNEENQ